ncbi:MAG: hypothetical protein K2N91_02415, partial [Muribaculaceae bacterium]|nr:hypothetical protein [Muribaculaceae bacterium]
MPKKYIIGFDFGHGETAAWVVPLAGVTDMDPNGESLRLKATNNVNDRVRYSVVFKNLDGSYTLEAIPRSALIGKMKSRVSDLNKKPELKEAYRAYIRLVVESVLKLNPILKVKDTDGKPNFYMCMASPTKWNDQDKNDYLAFFNEAVKDLGVSFEWIINESDAAFFSHKDKVNHDEVTLVIDYGSSTIDYTVMYQGKKVSKDEWSNGELGAGSIERDILNSYRANDYDGYQTVYSGAQALLISTGNRHINIENMLDYQCRLIKEGAYTNGVDSSALEYHFGPHLEDMSFRRHRFEYDFSMSEVTAHYRSVVEGDIRNLTDMIKNDTGKNVNTIILSGGACIMTWVPKMVKAIFPNAKIIDDRNPSFVVARGIALYAAAQKNALEELKASIKSEDFEGTYRVADSQATKDAI